MTLEDFDITEKEINDFFDQHKDCVITRELCTDERGEFLVVFCEFHRERIITPNGP